MNNVGSTTLLHPVFNNLEQVIIFGRVYALTTGQRQAWYTQSTLS